jgi:hypothetical protein
LAKSGVSEEGVVVEMGAEVDSLRGVVRGAGGKKVGMP